MNLASVSAAVITASVAVFVAVVAQVSTWTLEHHNRVYERRRAALLDLQAAALAVRTALRDLGPELIAAVETAPRGPEVAVAEDPRSTAARSDAEALLAMYLARVESPPVRATVRDWHQAARFSFLGGDDDVTARDEEAGWALMNDLIGTELTVPGWWGSRRAARERRRGRR